MLILSTNHCSNRLALSLAESKQNMAKIICCPAYLAADPALITLAIIFFTASVCLGGGGSRDDGGDNGCDDAGNDARKGDGGEASRKDGGGLLTEDAAAVAAAAGAAAALTAAAAVAAYCMGCLFVILKIFLFDMNILCVGGIGKVTPPLTLSSHLRYVGVLLGGDGNCPQKLRYVNTKN